MSPEEYSQLLTCVFKKFVELRRVKRVEDDRKYIEYDTGFLAGRKWYLLGETIVETEFRELINIINRWNTYLSNWEVFTEIISAEDETIQYHLQSEFIHPTAHFCVTLPSAIRDIITSVGTNTFHQVKLSQRNNYLDSLPTDANFKKTGKMVGTKRKDKEKTLQLIMSDWPNADEFLKYLNRLNDRGYINTTQNYRNLASHAIAPRFELGQTRFVTREVIKREKLVEVPSGGFILKEVPDKWDVGYNFSPTEPLNLEKILSANIKQFHMAVSCFNSYKNILIEQTENICLKF